MHLPESPITSSTRHRVVDADFAAVLEERFGIPTAFILRALKGEPHQPAVALCRLATRYEEPNGTLLMLARKFGRGRARRQRTAATPPRGHDEISPRPSVDRPGPDWGRDIAAPTTVAPGPHRGHGVNASSTPDGTAD
jgi:hypothetical protein